MKIGIKQLIETIGIFGIIASLIFVGVQLSQDRIIALGGAYQDRADSRKEDLRVQFESDSYAKDVKNRFERGLFPVWWNEGVASMHSEEGIPIEELSRWALRIQLDLYQLDNIIYQHELGLIDDAIVDAVLLNWQRGQTNPLGDGVFSMSLVRPETFQALKSVGWDIP